ncbi:MAG: hypothetical protein ACTS79_01480, partial [Arsenophonus sp. ET-KM2-MAG3]
DLIDKLPKFKQIFNMPTKRLKSTFCQEQIWQGNGVWSHTSSTEISHTSSTEDVARLLQNVSALTK